MAKDQISAKWCPLSKPENKPPSSNLVTTLQRPSEYTPQEYLKSVTWQVAQKAISHLCILPQPGRSSATPEESMSTMQILWFQIFWYSNRC